MPLHFLPIIAGLISTVMSSATYAEGCNKLCSRDYMFSVESGFDIIPLVAFEFENADGYMEDGKTPLMWAVLDPDEVDALYFSSALIFAGANVNRTIKDTKMSPLHLHILREGGATLPVVSLLIEEGANVLSENRQGQSVYDYVTGGVDSSIYIPSEVVELIREEAARQKVFKEATGLFRAERYDEALKMYVHLAEGDYVPAQYAAATILKTGRGNVEQDIDASRRWFETAAENGDEDSVFELGWGHYKGETFGRDDGTALMWFSKGARLGDDNSQAYLASFYANGIGVERDLKTAAMWVSVALRDGKAHPERRQFLNAVSSHLSAQDVEDVKRMTEDCILNFFEHC